MINIKYLSPIFIILLILISGAKQVENELKPDDVKLNGKMVCLSEEMHQHYKLELTDDHEHLYGIKSEDGKYYTLLRTSLSEALFIDKRLHEKVLVVKGRVFPKSNLLEVMSFMSIKDGVLYEIYYYCDTCYIRTVAPGNCDCCQAPVVLIEKPLNSDSLIPSP
ncbi:hypothetical protein C6497_04200 [Candidatus Poribacteria bacterium]|nr:MAG: hypothetical protein C6497_04200 [Candidatus Poribacteria bacterium]